jgi:hypothetical protein
VKVEIDLEMGLKVKAQLRTSKGLENNSNAIERSISAISASYL